MNVNPTETAGSLTSDIDSSPHPGPPTAHAVLEELFLLLEAYAPTWYTEEHHNRAVAALLGRNAGHPPTSF